MAANSTLSATDNVIDIPQRFFWDTNITVFKDFVLMLVVLKLIYSLNDLITAALHGNWYKYAANLVVKRLYKNKIPFDRALRMDHAPLDIVDKRRESLQTLSEKLQKFDYGSENVIHSTDSKLNPSCNMFIPSFFQSFADRYKFFLPFLWTGYEPATGYKLVDQKGNQCFDLASGNGVNIIGNRKIQQLAQPGGGDGNNGLYFAAGLSSVATQQAINSLLEIYRTQHRSDSNKKEYDCVSFCESGSAAVVSCIKQARFYHYKYGDTQRSQIVVFKNAYHGWIVNPCIGELGGEADSDVVILDALSVDAIQHIINNYLKIAAIFIDPMKIMSVNGIYPRESLTLGARKSSIGNQESIDLFVRWMKKLETVCRDYGILLVLDECYSGFRVGPYGATVQYQLNPDMIILSKQLGLGLNTTAIVSRKDVMVRKKEWAQVTFTTGTGSTNPQHHATMNRFLQYALTDEYRAIHAQKMQMFSEWCATMNSKFESTDNPLPIKLQRYFNTFTIDMLSNSYFNWMFALKLVANDVVLTPGGTTKFTLSFDYDADGLTALGDILLRCAQEMKEEGWFYAGDTNSKLQLLQTTVLHNLYQYASLFLSTIHVDKVVDVGVSHNHPVNRWTHFWSSLLQISIPYVLWWKYNVKFEAMITFLLLHILRQTGHFFYEAQLKHDEKIKIGYKNATKKKFAVFIPVAVCVIAILSLYYPLTFEFKKMFVLLGLLSIANRMVDISQCHGATRSLCWITKILTDPFTDLLDFYDSWNPMDKKIDFTVDWDKIKKNQEFYSVEF
mmetsp:Transcript_29833/g.48575  ORF Transcript_29833/g.48575 Transcript_29833/m.48575 type:complete len:785 (+) Transcript_29833:83-2437(+)